MWIETSVVSTSLSGRRSQTRHRLRSRNNIRMRSFGEGALLPAPGSRKSSANDQSGTDAQGAYLQASRADTSAPRRATLRVALHRYCVRDTLAIMVVLARLTERPHPSAG